MEKIDALLREKFEDFGENDWYSGFCEYEPKTLDYTEYLLGLHEEDIETVIWNNFSYDIEKDFPKVKAMIDSSNRYPLVKAFVQEREEKYYHYIPFNPPIKAERLFLKMMPDEDGKYLYKSIQKDSEAIPMFWNCLPGVEETAQRFNSAFVARQRFAFHQAFFGIYIADIATPIGYLGLTEYSKNAQGKSIFNLEYYLLPEHRRHGYVKEACQAAIEALKAEKISEVIATDREDIYTTRPFDPILILGKCHFENESSKHVLESLGFVYDGTCYESFFSYDGTPARECHYHLLLG